ncbi:MAG: hypothetical protein R3C17_19110 [Planctomycetaceae bacterium]
MPSSSSAIPTIDSSGFSSGGVRGMMSLSVSRRTVAAAFMSQETPAILKSGIAALMTEPLVNLTDLSEEQLAADPRIGMRRLAFEFLLQQEYFGTAAMMVAEYIATIQRIEAVESSGKLSPPRVKQVAILWRN